MTRLSIALLLTFLSTSAFAKHPLMERFDLDSDGVVTAEEFKSAKCTIRDSKFKAADKNSDGSLSKRELLKARHILAVGKNCPKKSAS